MNLRYFLWPFSLVFGAITALRNLAFDQGWLRPSTFDVPVIAVGNLSTGGTGKTPMVEFLINNLGDKKLGFVSRGYGRKTKGLVNITPNHTASEIGDEPLQIVQKHPRLAAAVSEKRAEGIQHVIQTSNPDLVLLDDAFQHRYVKADLNILLTTFQNPFYNDNLLPAGNLRENQSGKKRADIIIVTKCPTDLSEDQKTSIIKKIKPTESQSVFFSGLEYKAPVNNRGEELPEGKKARALTGIANPVPVLSHLSEKYEITGHWKYPDHYDFKEKDLIRIRQSEDPVITTEKDWVRLKQHLAEAELAKVSYLPLDVVILFDEKEQLMDAVKQIIESSSRS